MLPLEFRRHAVDVHNRPAARLAQEVKQLRQGGKVFKVGEDLPAAPIGPGRQFPALRHPGAAITGVGTVGIVVEFRQGGQNDLVHLPVKLPQPPERRLPARTQDAIDVFQDDFLGLKEGRIGRQPGTQVGKRGAVRRAAKTVAQQRAAGLAAPPPAGPSGCGRR